MTDSLASLPAALASLAAARTLLFVPGNRPERFAKARASGADAIVLDLEDAVPGPDKAAARLAIARAWPGLDGEVPVVVRINAPATEAGREDLRWLARLGRPAVMVPKAEAARDLALVRAALPGSPLLPLVESAAGFLALPRIARADGVLRLAIGHIDFVADTGLRCSDDERELDALRFAVAMHSRARNLAPAIDGVTVALDDEARLRQDARRTLAFGFGGKLCIHPRQVDVVHQVFAPSAGELDWARRVIDVDRLAGGAAVRVDGRMVDRPVVIQAHRTLARAGRRAG